MQPRRETFKADIFWWNKTCHDKFSIIILNVFRFLKKSITEWESLNFFESLFRLFALTERLKQACVYSRDNGHCSDEIHSCLRTFISNTARTATILNRDNTRRQCSKQYSRQCVETDQFWSLLRVNAQAANTR